MWKKIKKKFGKCGFFFCLVSLWILRDGTLLKVWRLNLFCSKLMEKDMSFQVNGLVTIFPRFFDNLHTLPEVRQPHNQTRRMFKIYHFWNQLDPKFMIEDRVLNWMSLFSSFWFSLLNFNFLIHQSPSSKKFSSIFQLTTMIFQSKYQQNKNQHQKEKSKGCPKSVVNWTGNKLYQFNFL